VFEEHATLPLFWLYTEDAYCGPLLVRWADVAVDAANSAVRLRRAMEQMCAVQPDMAVT
jgi:hypothetical protein